MVKTYWAYRETANCYRPITTPPVIFRSNKVRIKSPFKIWKYNGVWRYSSMPSYSWQAMDASGHLHRPVLTEKMVGCIAEPASTLRSREKSLNPVRYRNKTPRLSSPESVKAPNYSLQCQVNVTGLYLTNIRILSLFCIWGTDKNKFTKHILYFRIF